MQARDLLPHLFGFRTRFFSTLLLVTDKRENAFGDYIYRARQERGWPLREAAKRTGIAHSRLDELEKGRDWHSGKQFQPSYAHVISIAKAYGLPLDQLLELAGHEPGVELSAKEWTLIAEFRGLTEGHQAEVMAFIDSLKGREG